jgi:catechol 2,3-dioxygenase-like lactoylglutathione lyase family enzyme
MNTIGERPMFEKVAFTMLPVKDMKRARAFYEKTLGSRSAAAPPTGSGPSTTCRAADVSRSSRRRAPSRAGEGVSRSRSRTSMH